MANVDETLEILKEEKDLIKTFVTKVDEKRYRVNGRDYVQKIVHITDVYEYIVTSRVDAIGTRTSWDDKQ